MRSRMKDAFDWCKDPKTKNDNSLEEKTNKRNEFNENEMILS